MKLNLVRFTPSGNLKKVYYPKSNRRPVVIDEWHVIVKRRKAAVLLRDILFGGLPSKIPVKRLDTWSWKIREWVHLREFRYSDILNEARTFVKNYGIVEDVPEETIAVDLEALKAFENYMSTRRTELQTWRRKENKIGLDEALVLADVKSLALTGICAICGGDLPCQSCDLPAVEIDGHGGLKVKEQDK